MKKNYEQDPHKPERAQLKVAYFKTASHKERRYAVADEHAPLVRPKRNVSNLPNSYDDIYPSRYSTKSWKDKTKQRKQWNKGV